MSRWGTSGDNVIDHSLRTDDSGDLLFGLDGDDVIRGGDGDDYLWGDAEVASIELYSGKDKLFGGDGIDRLHGGGGNDYLDSGAGYNWLFGGTGDDILVMRGEITHAQGGSGDDIFRIESAGSGAYYWIDDSDAGDTLFWNGYQLTGGPKTILDFEFLAGNTSYSYSVAQLDANGVKYWYWDGEPSLTVQPPDGATITISDFENGDLGLNFDEGLFSSEDILIPWDPVNNLFLDTIDTDIPFSNIAFDDILWNFSDLTGFQDAITNYGPVPLPTEPLP